MLFFLFLILSLLSGFLLFFVNNVYQINDISSLTPLEDAMVEISDDEGVIQVLMPIGEGNYVGEVLPEEITNYHLKVVSSELPTVNASSFIPKKVLIQNFSVDRTLQSVNIDDQGYKASIEFLDETETFDFYALEVVIINKSQNPFDTFFDGNIVEVFIEDTDVDTSGENDIELGGPLLIEAQKTLFFSDRRYDDPAIKYDFFLAPNDIDLNNGDEYEIYAVLKTITEDYYEYLRTITFQKRVSGESIPSEPVQIFSNVTGGLGVFSGYDYDTKTFNIN